MSRGFTVVEVLVTLVIMTILLTLGTVGVRTSIVHARDAERKQDIEIIARALELRYDNGATYVNNAGTNVSHAKGSYPGSGEMWNVIYYGVPQFTSLYKGTTKASLRSPSGHNISAICMLYGYTPNCQGAAEMDSNIQASFSDGNWGWLDAYRYEFIGRDGKYCESNNCSRFNLYWRSEVDTTVYKGVPGLKVYRSKHQ